MKNPDNFINSENANEDFFGNPNENNFSPKINFEPNSKNFKEVSPDYQKKGGNDIFQEMDFQSFIPSSNFLSKNDVPMLNSNNNQVHESPIANYYAEMKLPDSNTPHIQSAFPNEFFYKSSNYIGKPGLTGTGTGTGTGNATGTNTGNAINNYFNTSPSAYFNKDEPPSPINNIDNQDGTFMGNQYSFLIGSSPEGVHNKTHQEDSNIIDQELYLRNFNDEMNFKNVEELEEDDSAEENKD